MVAANPQALLVEVLSDKKPCVISHHSDTISDVNQLELGVMVDYLLRLITHAAIERGSHACISSPLVSDTGTTGLLYSKAFEQAGFGQDFCDFSRSCKGKIEG